MLGLLHCLPRCHRGKVPVLFFRNWRSWKVGMESCRTPSRSVTCVGSLSSPLLCNLRRIPPHVEFVASVVGSWQSRIGALSALGVMISAMPAAVSRGRKRRRRQRSLAGADATRPPSTRTFPRVATAPANLAPSSTAAATTRAGMSAKTRPPPSPAFGDTSELDAQISTLAFIRAYGYGPVPGTPLRRGNRASASAGGSRCRTAMHGARDLLQSSGTEGSSTSGYDAPAAVRKVIRGEKQAKMRGKSGSPKSNRDPWMGPLDSRVSLALTTVTE